MPKKRITKKRASKPKSSKTQEPLRDWTLIASVVSMGFAVFLFMLGVVLNAGQLSTQIATEVAPTAPAAGLPENMILAFAVLLGIIGSATFVILRRGA